MPGSTENWTTVIEHGEDNERDARTCGMPHNTWEATATDSGLWLEHAFHSGLRDYEEKRCDALREKRQKRKAIQLQSDIDTCVCHVCGQL